MSASTFKNVAWDFYGKAAAQGQGLRKQQWAANLTQSQNEVNEQHGDSRDVKELKVESIMFSRDGWMLAGDDRGFCGRSAKRRPLLKATRAPALQMY